MYELETHECQTPVAHWPFAPLTEAQYRARSLQEAAIRREAARAEYEARNRCRVRQQGGAQ